jgi:hypothetical protein
MAEHAKPAHAGDKTAKDSGHVGKHRAAEAPVFEVRLPAEQAAYIQQQREGKASRG